ncbi:MAG: chitobiase/beta-hexosaminidase C-terminal domain-containing protein [Oscillospiraceae bacterium]|nr:chitobiase/beta-hexosaminidase C-terminal domain-containing protein [Oscillospiraceae bacterium]
MNKFRLIIFAVILIVFVTAVCACGDSTSVQYTMPGTSEEGGTAVGASGAQGSIGATEEQSGIVTNEEQSSAGDSGTQGGIGAKEAGKSDFSANSTENGELYDVISTGYNEPFVVVSGDGIEGKMTFTLAQLLAIPDAAFEHVYSTINNWPTPRFYAARGVRAASLLEAAGVLDTASVVTFRSYDSYEVMLTRKQLLEDAQYYFPAVEDRSDEGAVNVAPILAYEFKEGTQDISKAIPDDFCLIIGQRNYLEHTNHAFVENLSEIIVSSEQPEQWREATIFPASGRIPVGDSIKLQHPDFGLVKLYYTLDGTDPTELSTMYNPSTYQLELNKPIVFTESATLKVLTVGFGREDSSIAVFEIVVDPS